MSQMIATSQSLPRLPYTVQKMWPISQKNVMTYDNKAIWNQIVRKNPKRALHQFHKKNLSSSVYCLPSKVMSEPGFHFGSAPAERLQLKFFCLIIQKLNCKNSFIKSIS